MISEKKQNEIYEKIRAETGKEAERLYKEGKEEEAYEYEAREMFRYIDACSEEDEKEEIAKKFSIPT